MQNFQKEHKCLSETFRADIQDTLSDKNILWDEFRNSTVLVTGATGLIGNILIQMLSAANAEYNLNMQLIGHGRNKSRCEVLAKKCKIEIIESDISALSLHPGILDKNRIDYIFHCAAITKSADMVAKPVDVMATAVDGTRDVLRLTAERNCKSLVYLSSMEVYGQTVQNEVTEEDMGYLDLSTPRSSYPESKRFCEMLCVAHTKQCGLPVKIARLSQTFGAGVPSDDTRVFAQFARSVLANNDIVLHTEGKSRGNFCYTSDTIRGLLTILLLGRNGETYNIANPKATMTIREMAELVASDMGSQRLKVFTNIPNNIQECGYAPDVNFRLNVSKLNALGWSPKYGLYEMYQRMIADWCGR